MQNKSPALLPPGLQDLLPPESDREAFLVQKIANIFRSFGYRYVKPPLMEFESSFLASAMGYALSNQTFRLMDPESHEMMALRADITPQIVRLAQSRMPNSPRPLRLYYAADSLRVKAGQIRTARQFTQIGCECIGLDDVEVDLEICILALKSLNVIGLKEITLDLNLPSLIPSILAKYQISGTDEDRLLKALHHKDRAFIEARKGKEKHTLLAILDAAGPIETGLARLRKLSDIPESERKRLDYLESLWTKIKKTLENYDAGDVTITLDCADNRGFDYHSGFAFTLFSPQIQGEIGRGGRYRARFDINNEPQSASGSEHSEKACGFSLYTDNLRQIIRRAGRPKRLALPVDISWKDVQEYQEQGWVVIRQIDTTLDNVKLLKMGVTHKLEDGKIIELERS